MMDIDDRGEQKPIDLMTTSEINDLMFKFLIRQENVSYDVKFCFEYSFTQNQGLENEEVFQMHLNENVVIRSDSPFHLEWSIQHNDPLLTSIQRDMLYQAGAPGVIRHPQEETLSKFRNVARSTEGKLPLATP